MNRRGSVPIAIAAALPPIFLMGVFAIDAARIWAAQARLQAAIDAAALMAARDPAPGSTAEANTRNANVEAVVKAYFGGTSASPINISTSQPTSSSVQVQGTVSVTPLLTKLGLGIPNVLKDAVSVTRSATAQRTSTGLEMALVFDTTLSMAQKSNTTGLQHIESARDASLEMLKILYGDQPNATRREYLDKLYVSIVPFNIAVNIGTSNAHMLDSGATAPNYSNGFSWSGCVEARQDGYHLTDAGPKTSGFRRYYWPNTYHPSRNNSNGSCTATQSYMGPSQNPQANRVCMGHNDWDVQSNVASAVSTQNTFLVDANKYVDDALGIDNKTLSFGPNMMCPTQPITPLTMDRKTVEARLALLPNLPFAFGTMLPTGLQGAWYTLSPQWRANTTTGGTGWSSVEPTVNDGRPAIPAGTLPLNYATANMRKVIVLLSDGDNNWPNARNITQAVDGKTEGNQSRVVWPENTKTELFYTAYGLYTTETRLGIETMPARSLNHDQLDEDYADVRGGTGGSDYKLDQATRTLCTNIKKDNQITVYVVGFGIAAESHRDLLKACATSTNHFLEAATPEQLKAKFATIAQELANLRLSQ